MMNTLDIITKKYKQKKYSQMRIFFIIRNTYHITHNNLICVTSCVLCDYSSISTTLFFPVSPFIILIFDLATLYSLLSISINFLFASPSTGGEVIFIFRLPSAHFVILFKEDFGITLIFRRIFN